MDVQAWVQIIGQLGFPIFVAVFMLVKQSKDTEQMTGVLKELQVTIQSLVNKMDKE
jgi:GTP-binding protein EngB required for normal cell division